MTALAPLSLVEAAQPPKPAKARRPRKAVVKSVSMLDIIQTALDDAKAEDVITIDLAGRSSLADQMVVATGRADRHVGAIADRVLNALKDNGFSGIRSEGMQTCEWVLIDAGDVIVHVFKPDARAFYNIERLWGPGRSAAFVSVTPSGSRLFPSRLACKRCGSLS